MSVRSPNTTFSFELLKGKGFSDGGDGFLSDHHGHQRISNSNHNRKKKNKKKHKKSKPLDSSSSSSIVALDPIDVANECGVSLLKTAYGGSCGGESVVSTVTLAAEVVEAQSLFNRNNSFRELRQRTVNGGGGEDERVSVSTEESGVEVSSRENHHWRGEQGGSLAPPLTKLETAESLDWKSLMAKDPNNFTAIERSPIKYFLDEMYKGNSLRSTTTLGSEKEREKVYDTIFRLPWRCELLIDVGFIVCLDSFLSLLTVMPTRIVITLWRLFRTRQFKKLSADELSDLGCLFVLASGVALLGQTDISLIYHMIRGQGTIKLYVVYNVLEIFDKLFQSFGGDVMETLFNSAEGLASSSPENRNFWLKRFFSDQGLAMAVLIVHSFILLAQAVTLSTCIVAHNNALFALLVSNNFAEIKSNVFKRFSRDNIHSLVYADSVERFHMSAFLLFVLAQNILEAEGPWFESFLSNALLVFLCEVLIDIIKHSFLAKFNDIKPIAYSEFLEELCNQALDIRTEKKKRNLTFVPLAPACVVIRVLSPVYGARLPCNPLPWRWFWILLLCGMTYTMLTSLKLMTWISLEKFSSWYIKRCQNRRNHLHAD